MSADVSSTQAQPLDFLNKVPLGRMFLFMGGIVMMIVVVIFVLRLSQSPSKQMLYSGLNPSEVPLILEVLEANSVPYALQGKDTILIPSVKISAMKMELATMGLPKGGSKGYDVIGDTTDVYGKTEMEQYVLYKRATEEEIEASIKSMEPIQKVKVLLAIPKTNRLLRNKGKVKASVNVTTWDGLQLSANQINGIVKVLVDSVPELDKSNVSVVDSKGNLLNTVDEDGVMSSQKLDFVKNIEQDKVSKVMQMVESFVGVGNVRVAVTAEVDFSHKELRRDDYDSENPTIRSQQIVNNRNGVVNGGIPGSFSNQPASAGVAPEKLLEPTSGSPVITGTEESVTNFEIGKASSYEVNSKGSLSRLAISVVINQKQVSDGNGGFIYEPRTMAELERITSLVKAAVGFKEPRGDVLFVLDEQFEKSEVDYIISDESPNFLESPWIGDAVTQFMGLVLVLAIFFGIVNPIMKNTSKSLDVERANNMALAGEKEKIEENARRRARELRSADTPEEMIAQSKHQIEQVLTEDGKLVSQILKHWLANGA